MVRVLQMIGSLNVGGSQTMVLNLYRNTDREKLQFDFVLDHPDERYFAADVEALGARIYSMPGFNGLNAGEIRRAWDAFLTEHPDYKVLHSHVRSYASIYLPVAKRHGMKTIIHSHNTSNGSGISAAAKQLLQRPLRDQADVLMACSREAGEWLYGKKACMRDNFVFLPNAVDTARYRLPESVRDQYRAKLDLSDKLVVGHVGRFHRQKNHAFLLDVFKALHDRRPDSALLLVGDGELREQTEARAAGLGLSDCVVFTGNRPDVPELLRAMDVFVFPSVWEGLPVSLIEAQASGLPCLVSESVTSEACISPLTEKLPVGDAGCWADKILAAPPRRDVTEYIVRAGFDVRESAKRMTELYLKLAGESGT